MTFMPNLVSVRVAVMAASLALFGGCTCPPAQRINHFHSDANQKVAEDAVDQFKDFTVGSPALGALLDKNLAARQALEPAATTRTTTSATAPTTTGPTSSPP